jgi:hypothetical protein
LSCQVAKTALEQNDSRIDSWVLENILRSTFLLRRRCKAELRGNNGNSGGGSNNLAQPEQYYGSALTRERKTVILFGKRARPP